MLHRDRYEQRTRYNEPQAFYTEALPCESCGEPTELERVWNPEYELWIATDCQCSTPAQEPVCQDLYAVLMSQSTVGAMRDAAKQHRATCVACGGVAPELDVCRYAELLVAQQLEAGKLCDLYRRHAASCPKCNPIATPAEFEEAA